MYKQAYYRGGAVMNKTKLQWEKLFSEDRERKTKLSYKIRHRYFHYRKMILQEQD